MDRHRQSVTLVGLVLGIGLLGGCSSSPPPMPVEAAATAGGGAGGGPLADIASYQLGPGDALRVGREALELYRQLRRGELKGG